MAAFDLASGFGLWALGFGPWALGLGPWALGRMGVPLAALAAEVA